MRQALWIPGWYALDQPIEVGSREREFHFWEDPTNAHVAHRRGLRGDDLLFYNTLWGVERAVEATGAISAITHAVLGQVVEIDAVGLDYRLVLAAGRTLMVNAEETPGMISELVKGQWERCLLSVDDWTFVVQFSSLGPLRPAR